MSFQNATLAPVVGQPRRRTATAAEAAENCQQHTSQNSQQLLATRDMLAQPASDLHKKWLQRVLSSTLHRYQHYAASLGRELAILLLCHGSSALTAIVRLCYQLSHVLGVHLHRWLSRSKAPAAAAAVLGKALGCLRRLLQQHVARPLGRLLTQLVWVQVQLSADDVMDEGTRVSARVNSCVSLLFGAIRCVGVLGSGSATSRLHMQRVNTQSKHSYDYMTRRPHDLLSTKLTAPAGKSKEGFTHAHTQDLSTTASCCCTIAVMCPSASLPKTPLCCVYVSLQAAQPQLPAAGRTQPPACAGTRVQPQLTSTQPQTTDHQHTQHNSTAAAAAAGTAALCKLA